MNRGFALDDVLVMSPTLVLNVRYGLTDQDFSERRSSQGFDLASLGFSPALTGLVRGYPTLPRVSAGGYSSFGGWESGDGVTTSLTHSVGAHFTKLQGNHNLKFGSDFRVYQAAGHRFPLQTAPDLGFGNAYTRGPFDNSAAAPLGQELASLLLGIPSGEMERTEDFSMMDRYLGLYLQDDFKVSSKLTLNVGLRYEYETPLVERADRLVAGFAFDASNPIEAAARANYAAAPIPELPVDQFRARGGLLWVNEDGRGRSPFEGEKNNVMPRVGLAYRLTQNTILRGGYGMFFDTIGVNATRAIQTGFSQTTPIQASLDNGLTFVASTANPFPNGLLAPRGSAGGLQTNLGQALEFYLPERKHPYSQRWSVGVQQLLPWQFVGEATYVGNRGHESPRRPRYQRPAAAVPEHQPHTRSGHHQFPERHVSQSVLRDEPDLRIRHLPGRPAEAVSALRKYPGRRADRLFVVPRAADSPRAPPGERIHLSARIHLVEVDGSDPVPERGGRGAVRIHRPAGSHAPVDDERDLGDSGWSRSALRRLASVRSWTCSSAAGSSEAWSSVSRAHHSSSAMPCSLAI